MRMPSMRSTGKRCPFVIDDLRLLEPEYLRTSFDPFAYGFDTGRLASALASAAPETIRFLKRYVRESVLSALDLVEQRAVDERTASPSLGAERDLLDYYAFQLTYRKYPEDYEIFSKCQTFAFDRIFPESLYRGRIVLDVGCGTGKLIDHLSPVASQLIGIDAVREVLVVAKRKHSPLSNVTFLQGTFSSLPISSGSVDAVVSNWAFPSRPSTGGGTETVQELLRVLKPGGHLRMTVYNQQTVALLCRLGFNAAVVDSGVRYFAPPLDCPVVEYLQRLAIGDLDIRRVTAIFPVTVCSLLTAA